jgi:hypothetical protein
LALVGHAIACLFILVSLARLFPQEGGAAILEIEVPESIAKLGINAGGEIRFIPG